jgi:hypothetical protein
VRSRSGQLRVERTFQLGYPPLHRLLFVVQLTTVRAHAHAGF